MITIGDKESDYIRLIFFICIQMLLETIIFISSSHLLYKRSKISLIGVFLSFFNKTNGIEKEYLSFLIWCVSHVTTDVFIAKILYDKSNF